MTNQMKQNFVPWDFILKDGSLKYEMSHIYNSGLDGGSGDIF